MSLELPRLSPFTLFGEALPALIKAIRDWMGRFQIDWQKTVEAIEAHEIVQEALLDSLSTAQGDLTVQQLALQEVTDELAQAVADIQTNQAATAAAQAAADAADAAAEAAALAATTANNAISNITAPATFDPTAIDLAPGAVLKEGGVQVVGPQQGAVADPAGGVTVDAEARAQLAAALAALRAHGLIAP